jgi:ABC-type lipoprotein release transport system permease subunit
MLVRIAWRNIWRNRTRSLIIITAIALGLFGSILSIALSNGMTQQRIRSAFELETPHIQIQQPGFVENPEVSMLINSADKIELSIKELPHVRSASRRILVTGMIASPTSNYGIRIIGIIPPDEKNIIKLKDKLVQGSYFESTRRNPIIISRRLADKLNVKLHSKVVLTFQDIDGYITGGAFRIVGVYQSVSSSFDESHVFVRYDDLMELLGISQDQAHQIAVMVDNLNNVSDIKHKLQRQFPEFEVRSWMELYPELSYMNEVMDQMLYIFMAVILLALAFGIVNTMLMAVLERTHEFGVLMAIGMKPGLIFKMIVIETVFLSITGGIAGMIISYIGTAYLEGKGIDLSIFAEGLSTFGLSTIIYPELKLTFYIELAAMIIIVAIFSAFYPAIKALKLKPVEAIRKK